MNEYSDEKLIDIYLKGREEAFEILIKRYLKSVYTLIFRLIGNKQESEDITQEVFIKTWKNLKKIKKGKKLKSWIFTVAKNSCIDWLRKKQPISFSKLERNEKNNFFAKNIPDIHSSPAKIAEEKNLANVLKESLENLSFEYRFILILRYNDHFKFREIAEILGKPLNTVKSEHLRAIKQLRNYLKNKI